MGVADNGKDYHSLLSLHHSMQLRRRIQSGVGNIRRNPSGTSHSEIPSWAPTPDDWPQRADDQRLLQESLAVLDPLEEALGLLYTTLFAERPFLRVMFPDSLMTQRQRLKWALLHLIDALGDTGLAVEMFEHYGREHRKLGVRAAHYTPFGEALFAALRMQAGPRWRDDFAQAWQRAYWYIARLMILASEQTTSEPPYTSATVIGHDRRRHDIAVLHLRPAHPFVFRAGQHTAVESPRLPRTWRYYSMANPPGPNEPIELHIKATGSGRLSDVLVDKTEVGDLLRLGPATGGLAVPSLPLPGGRGLLLIAGGTGLAPIRSLLGEVARHPTPPTTWLFVGARHQSGLYDLPALVDLARRSPWLRLIGAVSDTEPGPFEQGSLPQVVARRGSWIGHHAVVSGPPAMVAVMRSRLVDLGVSESEIHVDPQ